MLNVVKKNVIKQKAIKQNAIKQNVIMRSAVAPKFWLHWQLTLFTVKTQKAHWHKHFRGQIYEIYNCF